MQAGHFSNLSLFDAVRMGGFTSLSIIGLAKNVGKTTTLNYLISGMSGDSGIIPGLSSTGWDGESYDSITGDPKPKIMVKPGSFVATTDRCLSRSTLPCRAVEETGMQTPLGEVVIIEAEGEGRVEIAGPSTISGLIEIREKMKRLGCNLIIFDGAINRMASAAPSVCDGVILATGANAGYHLQDVKNRTSFVISSFSLRQWDRGDIVMPESTGYGESLLIDDRGDLIESVSFDSLGFREAGEDRFLLIRGAITDEMVEALIQKRISLSIVAEDVTKLFLSPGMVRRWKKRGGQIILKDSTKIIGVTVNPGAVSGKSYDALQFLVEMGELCAPYPTWDVVLGKGMNLG